MSAPAGPNFKTSGSYLLAAGPAEMCFWHLGIKKTLTEPG